MREGLRVFRVKTLMILLVLSLINVGIFVLCADSNKDITLQGEQLEEYLKDYPDYIERTKAQADKLSMLAVYKKGFSAEKVKKTGEAYGELGSLTVTEGDNRGIIMLTDYRLTDIFLMIFLFLMVMDFGVERTKGLSGIVRSTRKGRSVLYFQRVLWLALGTIIATVILYGSIYIGTKYTLGIGDLSRSIQSLPEFAKCTKPVTIGQFFLQVCIRKAVAAYMAGLILYLLMGICSESLAVFATVLLFAEQFVTATFITPVSALNHLRYVNLYTMLRGVDFYENSIYLNFFDHAVVGETLAMGILLVGLPLLLALGALLYGLGYLQGRRLGEKLVDRIMRLREQFSVAHSLPAWECYKLLIRQKGALMLVAIVALQFLLAFRYEYYFPINTFEQLYYLEFHGEITEESIEAVERKKQYLLDTEKRMSETREEILAATPINSDRLFKIDNLLSANRVQQDNLEPVLANMREGMEYTQNTGNTVQLVEPYSYDLILNRDLRTRKRASLLELIGIIGIIAGIYSLEKQNHMEQLLRYSYRGRVQERVIKPILMFGFCFLLGVSVHMIQFVHVQKSLGFPDLTAPVQSIQFMRDFPIYISIWGFFVLLFAVRGLMAVLCGSIVAGISKVCSNYITALGIAFFAAVILIAVTSFFTGLSDFNLFSLLGAEFVV